MSAFFEVIDEFPARFRAGNTPYDELAHALEEGKILRVPLVPGDTSVRVAARVRAAMNARGLKPRVVYDDTAVYLRMKE